MVQFVTFKSNPLYYLPNYKALCTIITMENGHARFFGRTKYIFRLPVVSLDIVFLRTILLTISIVVSPAWQKAFK